MAVDPRFAARKRQAGLDLLRACAIVIVVIYHAGIFGFALPYRLHRFGWIGVDLFFVLSGYLIGGQLLAPRAYNQPIKLGRFYARRALRIMPAYFSILALYFCLPSLREFPSITPLWKFLISVQNIDLQGGTAFSHAWSLAIEDQFYLLLPFVLILGSRYPRVGSVLPVAIFVGGLALRGFLAHLHPGNNGEISYRGFQKWIYYPTWTRLDPLVFGVAIAAVEKFRAQWWNRLTQCAYWLWLPGVVAIICGLRIGDERLTMTTCIWQFPLLATGMSTLLICALSPQLPLHRLRIPGAAFIASIAYSVYLSHKLVIHAIIKLCDAYHVTLTSWLALLLVEVSIYLAGTLLFLTVERPFLLLRRKIAD